MKITVEEPDRVATFHERCHCPAASGKHHATTRAEVRDRAPCPPVAIISAQMIASRWSRTTSFSHQVRYSLS